ncbi:MAG: hypothetical protein R3B84_23975 [Zavarzinella sp.]
MNSSIIHSRTLWQRMYEQPDNNQIWTRFHQHYSERIYNWAKRILRSDELADMVTLDVFQHLHKIITDPERKRVEAINGTCAGFIHGAVKFVCNSYLRKENRERAKLRELAHVLANDESTMRLEQSIQEAEVEEQKIFVLEHFAELSDLYKLAVLRYKASQATLKEQGQSWEIFLAAYSRDPEHGMGKLLDAQFKIETRGYALKAANRVAKSLFKLMQLPSETDAEWNQSETILRELVKKNGDPSK